MYYFVWKWYLDNPWVFSASIFFLSVPSKQVIHMNLIDTKHFFILKKEKSKIAVHIPAYFFSCTDSFSNQFLALYMYGIHLSCTVQLITYDVKLSSQRFFVLLVSFSVIHINEFCCNSELKCCINVAYNHHNHNDAPNHLCRKFFLYFYLRMSNRNFFYFIQTNIFFSNLSHV